MARSTRQQIGGADASQVAHARATALAPAASPVSTFVTPEDSEFTAFAKGLGALHEPLARIQGERDDQALKDEVIRVRAEVARADNPGEVDTTALVASTPPAIRSTVLNAAQESLGTRLGVDAAAAMRDEYARTSRDPGFSLEQFTADFRSKNLAGLNGALAINAAPHLDSAITQMRADFRGLQEQRLTEGRHVNLSAALSGMDPNASAGERLLAFEKIATQNVKNQGTRAEAANAFFEQTLAQSIKDKGRRDLFDVFDEEVPGLGQPLSSLVPGLKVKVEQAKVAAESSLKQYLHEATMVTRGEQLTRIDKMLIDGTALRMGEEGFSTFLKQFEGSGGALSPEARTGKMNEFFRQQVVEGDKRTIAALFEAGQGASIPPEKAKPILALALAPATQALMGALTKPGNDNAAVLTRAANMIVNGHQKSGVSFPDETLQRTIESVLSEVPKDGEAVSQKFMGLATLYAAMERESAPLTAMYFGKTRALFEAYNRATVDGQVGSPTAYKQAYASIDPENIAAAQERTRKDPAFRAQIVDTARSATRSLFPSNGEASSLRFWPGADTLGKTPQTGAMEKWAGDRAFHTAMMNPNLSNDEVEKIVEKDVKANWFFEPTSKSMLQLPPKYNHDEGQKAVTGYLSAIKGNNPGVVPSLLHKSNGYYDVVFNRNGAQEIVQQNVNIDQLISLRHGQEGYSPAELRQLSEYRIKIEAGTATDADRLANEPIVSRARAKGHWSAALQMKAEGLAVKAVEAKSATTFAPAVGVAVSRGEFDLTTAIRPKTPDTAGVARSLYASGDLTTSLAAMGEGVRTLVYKDPAGVPTIGIGYNLTANAKTLAEDFRQAQIPAEFIDEIKAGKRHITVEQAVRLHGAVLPRYVAIAEKAVNARYPGEWSKLGENVRAVLTDIAYQTGNLEQFQNGLTRILAGDLSGEGLEVTFKNDKTGKRQVAVGRHTLRASMLRSSTSFETLLNHAAKQPANALQRRLADGS